LEKERSVVARFVATVAIPRQPAEAFDYLADLRNFAEWDPGVVSSTRIAGAGFGVGTEYDVTVRTAGSDTTLRYRVTDFDPPASMRIVGSTRFLASIDEIRVEPTGEGARVTYDAELKLRGPLRIFDRLLQPAFDRIGAKAAAGLGTALDGQLLEA
jgi:carbon monoxide dehydrogenase subunit G